MRFQASIHMFPLYFISTVIYQNFKVQFFIKKEDNNIKAKATDPYRKIIPVITIKTFLFLLQSEQDDDNADSSRDDDDDVDVDGRQEDENYS